MSSVRLEPISPTNVKAVFDLEVASGQERFVADNAWSLAEAVPEQATAWPHATHGEDQGDDEVDGFQMLEIDPDDLDDQPYLGLGFVPTGEIDEGEVVAKRTIEPADPPATVGTQ